MHRTIAIVLLLFTSIIAHARMGDDCIYAETVRAENHRPWRGERAVTLTDPPSSAVTNGIAAPILKKFISPIYPKELSHWYGPVVATVIIDTDGRLLKVITMGEPDYPLPAVQAARDAIAQWRFQPGESGGKPIRTHITVEILFDADTRTTGACIE